MKINVKTYLGVGLLLFASGCVTTEIPEAELPDFVNKIVINASLDNRNIIEIEVSDAAGAYTTDLPETVSNATLMLSSSKGNIPITYNPTTQTYRSNRTADFGETYTLIGSRPDYRGISAQCVIPGKLLNKTSGFIENGGIDVDGLPADKLFVKFDDPAGRNFYIAHFYYYSESASLFIPFDFALTDQSLNAASTVKLIDGGYMFTDDLFNGTTKELSVVAPRGLVSGNPDIKYLIELRSISNDYYKYVTTLKRYQDNQDQQNNGPFGSSVIVHSNVSGGLGVFISSSLESDTLR